MIYGKCTTLTRLHHSYVFVFLMARVPSFLGTDIFIWRANNMERLVLLKIFLVMHHTQLLRICIGIYDLVLLLRFDIAIFRSNGVRRFVCKFAEMLRGLRKKHGWLDRSSSCLHQREANERNNHKFRHCYVRNEKGSSVP